MDSEQGGAQEESVILISDDEAESPLGNSVLVVEPLQKPILEDKKAEEIVDEECELVVTFCKQGKVMPHARYDCMTHTFERAECETCSPLENNANICDQCYCYICDKLASECQNWTAPSHCHCNAHNKSTFWKDQRGLALTGVLVMFNLELTDIDEDLRHGGNLLIKFVHELSVEYNTYLVGERVSPNSHECFCHPKRGRGKCNICRQHHVELIYRYSGVCALVTKFLNQAEKENPKAAAVMLLGAAKEIALHKDPAQHLQNLGHSATLKMAVPCLMESSSDLHFKRSPSDNGPSTLVIMDHLHLTALLDLTNTAAILEPVSIMLHNSINQDISIEKKLRLESETVKSSVFSSPLLQYQWFTLEWTSYWLLMITTQLQRMLVLCDFPKVLYEKFISFFQMISLPCHCYGFSNSLNVVPWDHGLLTTVLKGQNITGQRTQKGKKVFLWEGLHVIQARVEKMENQGHYKEIVRYLKAVKCNDVLRLRKLRDKIPFYLCKSGDFVSAVHSLLLPFNNLACCTACRITPFQFEIYLKMFRTGSVPCGNNFHDPGDWISTGSPLKTSVLIKHALKLLYCNLLLYRNPKCWSSLIMVLGSDTVLEKNWHLHAISLKEPPPDFQEMVVSVSSILLNELKTKVNVSLPSNVFSGPLQLEASLILTVQAVQQMLLNDLPYLSSFLEITLAFGNNFWALRLLLNGLSCEEHILHGTINLLLRDLNFQKSSLLHLWKKLGPQYVGELLCLYLTCRNRKMQSIGIFIIHVISENLHMFRPWTHLRNFLNTGLRKLPLGTTADHEVAKFIAVLEKM